MTTRTGYVYMQADRLQPGDVLRAYAPNVVSGEPRVDRRGVVHVELQSPRGYFSAAVRYYKLESVVIRARDEGGSE